MITFGLVVANHTHTPRYCFVVPLTINYILTSYYFIFFRQWKIYCYQGWFKLAAKLFKRKTIINFIPLRQLSFTSQERIFLKHYIFYVKICSLVIEAFWSRKIFGFPINPRFQYLLTKSSYLFCSSMRLDSESLGCQL